MSTSNGHAPPSAPSPAVGRKSYPSPSPYTSRKRSPETVQLLKKSTAGSFVGDLDPASEESRNQKLIIYFVLMLIFALGNTIFGRLQVYPMHNYPLFCNIVLVLMYIPACFAYILPMQWFTDVITKEQTEIPKYKFFVMGWYDSISSILQVYAVNYIHSNSLTVLVQQAAIPISMLISRSLLNSQYTTPQYVGAAIVMLGIVLVVIPQLIGGDSDTTGSDASSTANTISNGAFMQLVWLLTMVVSCVPMCLSSVYKEKALGEIDVDVTYLNGWVGIFQFLISIPLCIPSSQVQNMPLSEIMPNIWAGFKCWAGINTITEDYNPLNAPLDQCSTAPFYTTAYLIFNLVYNFLTVVVLKYGSANVLWLASTLIVPLSDIAFSLKFIPGSEPMTSMDLIGLIVIMAGLIIYRFNEQLFSLWRRLLGQQPDKEELLKEKMKQRISRRQIQQQAKYFGLNQIASLQTLVDSRISRAQMLHLMRSPRVIRESYLMKIGVDPSPKLTVKKSVQPSPLSGYSILSRNSSMADSRRISTSATQSPNLQRGNSFIGVPSKRPHHNVSDSKLSYLSGASIVESQTITATEQSTGGVVNGRYGAIPTVDEEESPGLTLDV